jgi:hypothetical protein
VRTRAPSAPMPYRRRRGASDAIPLRNGSFIEAVGDAFRRNQCDCLFGCGSISLHPAAIKKRKCHAAFGLRTLLRDQSVAFAALLRHRLPKELKPKENGRRDCLAGCSAPLKEMSGFGRPHA